MKTVDVAVIGGGFGGSLTALLLTKIGLSAAVIERGRHPRFALGESSTPQADLILARLADVYDLPRIRPLAAWGTWQQSYPELPCGLKRGFSYAHHQPGQPFVPFDEHRNELLVAASVGDDDADTHWHRATFDEFLFNEARSAGVECLEQADVTDVCHEEGWTLRGRRLDEAFCVRSKFLIDASGDGQFLARHLQLPSRVDFLKTRSRCVYSHFRNVRDWNDIRTDTAGGRSDGRSDFPFPVDASALHHVFPGGWMYVLPFNTGVTSAGFSLDLDRFPVPEHLSPADEWQQLLRQYPSIGKQFEGADIVDPPGAIRRTGRLQRFTPVAAGGDWAMLPTTAGILDALHSTGNAHTLSGMERLVELFASHWGRPTLLDALSTYCEAVRTEIEMLDQIVAGCYSAFDRFDVFVPFSMFYFVGATFAEHRRRSGDPAARNAYLCADLPEFRSALSSAELLLHRTIVDPSPPAVARFTEEVARLLAPFNVAGLCDPSKRNMYPFIS